LVRAGNRPRRPVVQSVLAVLQPSGVPFGQGLPCHTGLGRDVAHRAAGVDALAQPAASFRGQRGVTVGREGLLGAGVFACASHLTRRPSLNRSIRPRRVTNVPGYNNSTGPSTLHRQGWSGSEYAEINRPDDLVREAGA